MKPVKGYDMKDICVYTTPDVLEHKRSDGFDRYYWEFPHLPKVLKELDARIMSDFESVKDGEFPRLYFALSGNIVGYFPIEEFGNYTVEFYPTEWTKLKKPIPQKPFQGFKYLERTE